MMEERRREGLPYPMDYSISGPLEDSCLTLSSLRLRQLG